MSKIEWTDKAWNPIIGCSKVSPACDNCYAEKMAARLATMPQTADNYGVVIADRKWNGKTALVESALVKPLRWRKPCRVFVGSMTDLFHPSTPIEWIDMVFAVMAVTPHITYQVLTKRPDEMRHYIQWRPDFTEARKSIGLGLIQGLQLCDTNWPLSNVWIGVTVENQAMADQRIPILLDTPAAIRFVSVEPMLGPVDLNTLIAINYGHGGHDLTISCLDWVICGGETGSGSRFTYSSWAQDLRDQCLNAGTPFFFKQWGEYFPDDQNPQVGYGSGGIRVGKKAAGNMLDGVVYQQFPANYGG